MKFNAKIAIALCLNTLCVFGWHFVISNILNEIGFKQILAVLAMLSLTWSVVKYYIKATGMEKSK